MVDLRDYESVYFSVKERWEVQVVGWGLRNTGAVCHLGCHHPPQRRKQVPLGPAATHMGLFLPCTSATVCISQIWKGHVDNLVPKRKCQGPPRGCNVLSLQLFGLTFSPLSCVGHQGWQEMLSSQAKRLIKPLLLVLLAS